VRQKLRLSSSTADGWCIRNVVAKQDSPHYRLYHELMAREAPSTGVALDALFWNTLGFVKEQHDELMAILDHMGDAAPLNKAFVSLCFAYAQLGLCLMALNGLFHHSKIGKPRWPHFSNRLRSILSKKNPVLWLD